MTTPREAAEAIAVARHAEGAFDKALGVARDIETQRDAAYRSLVSSTIAYMRSVGMLCAAKANPGTIADAYRNGTTMSQHCAARLRHLSHLWLLRDEVAAATKSMDEGYVRHLQYLRPR